METEGRAEQHGTWFHAQSGEGEVGGGSTGTRPGVRVFESVKALLFIIIGRNETNHTKSEQHDKAVKTMFVSLKKSSFWSSTSERHGDRSGDRPRFLVTPIPPPAGLWGVHGPAA